MLELGLNSKFLVLNLSTVHVLNTYVKQFIYIHIIHIFYNARNITVSCFPISTSLVNSFESILVYFYFGYLVTGSIPSMVQRAQ